MTSITRRTRVAVGALFRMILIGGHLLIAFVIVLARVPWGRRRRPTQVPPSLVRWWYRRLLPLLGLRITDVRGAPSGKALIVANHVSWLDVPVLGALEPVNFLSKAEVRDWPLIGWMSAQLGTLFIKRGNHQAGELIDRLAAEVRDGRALVLFPEGTTSDGRQLRRFHPRLLAAAQQPEIGVQPVAIRYGTNADPDPIAPFIGDDNLLAHLWRLLRHAPVSVQVQFLDTISTNGIDRRNLAAQCRQAIAAALDIPLEPPPRIVHARTAAA